VRILGKMKKLRLSNRARKAFRGSSRGFSMLEVVIAIALLGIIAISVLSALQTAALALISADRRATAESIARSQMEYVQTSPYIDYSMELSERDPDFYEQITVESGGGDYNLETEAEPIDPNNHQPYDGEGGVFNKDDGIQKITVTVSYEGRVVVTLEDFKREAKT
jgi:prepilin-type N-terminal cleavage/methylation domain-containing protein